MILLMGLPGSGKGTQGKMLADVNGIHLLSMGDLVRMYVTGERRRQMLAGALLNDDEIIAMLDRVLRTMDDDDDCILDGFPRTIKQAEWLMEQVKQGRFEVNTVIYLHVTHDAVLDRLQARGRLDDTEQVIEARFKEYERLTQPVVNWLEERGVEILRIDGERSTEVVHRDIISKLHLS
ncbi:MAG TPA: nucleoside monophosphate kinase [Candidatus Saccharimonadales bacterium]